MEEVATHADTLRFIATISPNCSELPAIADYIEQLEARAETLERENKELAHQAAYATSWRNNADSLRAQLFATNEKLKAALARP